MVRERSPVQIRSRAPTGSKKIIQSIQVKIMAKKKKTVTHLVCEETGERNYTIVVSGGRKPGGLRVRKYCARLRKHTWHKESK